MSAPWLTALAVIALSTADLDRVRFLEGVWKAEAGKAAIEERWTDGAGGIMLGVSRTLVPGKKAFFEFLRIEARAEGVFYVAQPGGRPPTEFKLTEAAEGKAVFENPLHDHPKIIRYRVEGDALTAEVEGDEGKEQYRFHRSP